MIDKENKMKAKEMKSLFLEHLGDTPQLRVWDFLIDNHFFDFPMTGIAKGANISYNSLKVFFPKFVDSGVLVKTRRIGKSDYFKLNINHPFVSRLMQLDWNLAKTSVLYENKISENKLIPA